MDESRDAMKAASEIGVIMTLDRSMARVAQAFCARSCCGA
jgi:hypothetical protein